jgi:hypothetical protein
MAYPTVSAPYGFQPLNRVDGMPYAGATRQFQISGSYNTPIYDGDLVIVVTGGTIEKFTGTTTGSPAGVFVGAQYVNSLGQTVQGQYYPGTAATSAIGYVVDDPMVALKVAVTTSGSAMSVAALSAIGSNMSVVQGTGSATTGDSAQSVLAGSEATTATLPIRVIDVVPATQTSSGYPELVVKINLHQYNNTTGV